MRRKRRDNEKAKNLIGTWKKLLGYCRRYLAEIGRASCRERV